MKIPRARELLQELVCSKKYQFVYAGSFDKKNDTKHAFHLLRFHVETKYKGGQSVLLINFLVSLLITFQLFSSFYIIIICPKHIPCTLYLKFCI